MIRKFHRTHSGKHALTHSNSPPKPSRVWALGSVSWTLVDVFVARSLRCTPASNLLVLDGGAWKGIDRECYRDVYSRQAENPCSRSQMLPSPSIRPKRYAYFPP